MQKSAFLILIALFFGTGFGFLLAVSTGATLEGHDHAAHGHGAEAPANHTEHGHDHSRVIDLAGPDAPRLDMRLHEEPGGWNLEILTENFRFAPKSVNGAHVAGEGHAHIYIDDVKLARTYGPWFHIGALPDGAETLTVTLNSNDHSQLSVGGQVLSVTCALPECAGVGAGNDAESN